MKITKENALEEYPKVREGMPEAIEETFEKLPKLLKFYGRNDGITEVVDIWLEQVNAALAKREPKAEPEHKPEQETTDNYGYKVGDEVIWLRDNKNYIIAKLHDDGVSIYPKNSPVGSKVVNRVKYDAIKPAPKEEPKAEPKPKKEPKPKAEKPKKEPKPKAEKQPEKKAKEKKEPEGEPVAKISPEVAIIKRFVNCCKGDKGRETARKILAALQKHIVNKEIRKTSQYATEIMDIQKALITIVHKKKKPDFDKAEFERLEKIAVAEYQEPIAKLSRSFIGLIGKEGVKEKAKSLLQKLEDCGESDSLIDAMKKALQAYIDGKATTVETEERSLQGIYGLAGI